VKAQQTWSTPVRNENKVSVPCAICGGGAFLPFIECAGYSYVRCVDCGLVQINPQPEPAQVRERYGEAYFKYERDNEEAFFKLGRLALRDAGIDKIEKRLWDAGNRRALEIGCATGALLEYLRGRGWQTKGVEISKPEAEYAVRERGLDVSTLTLEDNRFASNHFAIVTASHLIEHLNDPAAFVGEVYRVLAPGGVFLVTTPNITGLQAKVYRHLWRSAIFDHLYLFSKKTLRKLLEKYGFEIEKTVTWGGIARGFAPKPIKLVLDRAAKIFGFGDVVFMRCIKR
jgi:SAM-dependent methyltransferase